MTVPTARFTLADLRVPDHQPPNVRPRAQISSQGVQGRHVPTAGPESLPAAGELPLPVNSP